MFQQNRLASGGGGGGGGPASPFPTPQSILAGLRTPPALPPLPPLPPVSSSSSSPSPASFPPLARPPSQPPTPSSQSSSSPVHGGGGGGGGGGGRDNGGTQQTWSFEEQFKQVSESWHDFRAKNIIRAGSANHREREGGGE